MRNGKSLFGMVYSRDVGAFLRVSPPPKTFLEDFCEDTMGLSGSKSNKADVNVSHGERVVNMVELLMLVNHLSNRFEKDTDASWKFYSCMDEQTRAVRREIFLSVHFTW